MDGCVSPERPRERPGLNIETDNYSSTLSYFVRQTGVEADDVRKYLEVGDDYEDIY